MSGGGETDVRSTIERPELATANWIDDVCYAYNHMIAQDGNILYIAGGAQYTTSGVHLASSHIYIMDLTAPIDLSLDYTVFVKVVRLPDHVPRLKWANMFVEDNTLRLFGGEQEFHPTFHTNGSRSYRERVPITDRLWTYNIKQDEWNTEDSSSGMGADTVGRAQLAWDPKGGRGGNGIGWIYGGTVETGQWIVGDNITGTAERLKELRGFTKVTGVKMSQTWKVERLGGGQQIGTADMGDLLFVEGVGESGLLVMVGGRSSNAMRSLNEIQVYDIATSTWFTQPATADKGIYPPQRQEACAVVVSAPDNSSHNIYLYAGLNLGQEPFDDLFVLTLPAFHWVYVGTGTELPSSSQKCAVVNERYMVSYRGKRGSKAGCDNRGGIQILDLTRLQWTGRMESVAKSNISENAQKHKPKRQVESEEGSNVGYEVPEKLYNIIGGNAQGGATVTAPKAGFVHERLSEIFSVLPKPTSTSPDFNSPDSDNADFSSSPPHLLSNGVIAGIALAAFAFILLLLAALYFVRRIHRRRAAAGCSVPPFTHHAELDTKYPTVQPLAELPSAYIGHNSGSYYQQPQELGEHDPNSGLVELHGTFPPAGATGAVEHGGVLTNTSKIACR
ncbi:hypothetical protein BDZ91DRAFT_839213 [Kalaharituber pfeilii]|nr:hypothetical protein BDZ91DRAFT_839213 [Kalaharituber pfeilii]